jgi:hypothetical protein
MVGRRQATVGASGSRGRRRGGTQGAQVIDGRVGGAAVDAVGGRNGRVTTLPRAWRHGWGEPGHYLFNRHGRHGRRAEPCPVRPSGSIYDAPWLDGGQAPRRIVEGEHQAVDMVELLPQLFPVQAGQLAAAGVVLRFLRWAT